MKPFWKSKTFWVNVLTLVISALTMIAGSETIDPQVVAIITGIAIPILNVVLRFVTNEPIGLTGGPRLHRGRKPYL